MGVSQNMGTPKSSILVGFSLINQPFWGTCMAMETSIYPTSWGGEHKPTRLVGWNPGAKTRLDSGIITNRQPESWRATPSHHPFYWDFPSNINHLLDAIGAMDTPHVDPFLRSQLKIEDFSTASDWHLLSSSRPRRPGVRSISSTIHVLQRTCSPHSSDRGRPDAAVASAGRCHNAQQNTWKNTWPFWKRWWEKTHHGFFQDSPLPCFITQG